MNLRKFITTIIVLASIVLVWLCLAQNAEAAPRYAKKISDITSTGEYVLEAADFPKSSTKKVGGRVVAPNASGWMDLIKYNASTAEDKHAVWYITNFVWDSYPDGGGWFENHVNTYVIFNNDPYEYWSTYPRDRLITYTSKGFYRMQEEYGSFATHYEYWNSPAQRYTIKKVRTDANGRAVFRFINVKSKIAMSAGGYSDFYIMIL